MNSKDRELELLKEYADQQETDRLNPLSQYSTTELKAELRRRKNQ